MKIEERDRPYFRLLCRDLHSGREPNVYGFRRVLFGASSTPMEAQFVAQENARRHQDVYPLAAEIVLKSTFMDDSIDSVETVQYMQRAGQSVGNCRQGNEYQNLWKLLQPRLKPTELLSCRLLWGRNLLSTHLVFSGIVQKIRSLFRLQTYLQSFRSSLSSSIHWALQATC